MTEREMLEAAARAAGMRVLAEGEEWPEDYGGWFYNDAGGRPNLWCAGTLTNPWNPRNCSAQALDLAAALRISVEHNHAEEARPWVCASIDGGPLKLTKAFVEDVPDESQRADRMRLAILRCAAAQPPKEQA